VKPHERLAPHEAILEPDLADQRTQVVVGVEDDVIETVDAVPRWSNDVPSPPTRSDASNTIGV